MAELETKVFHIDALREFSTGVFLHFGVPQEDAAQAADVLASADLRGIDSHGVARLYSYFGMLSEGHINPKPRITTVRSTLSTATIDGDNGLGLVVGPLLAYGEVGLDVMWTGIIGGSCAYGVHRLRGALR